MPDKNPKQEVYEELRKRYVTKLQESLRDETPRPKTRQYAEFRNEYMPKPLTWYESACNFCERLMVIPADKSKRPEMLKAIEMCHLQVTPEGVTSFAILAPLALILTAFLAFFLIPWIFGFQGVLFIAIYVLFAGLILIFPLLRIPYFIANSWRMRASNQMVLCVFYVVTYMRHTSNLELAIDFAAEHLDAPLSLDMKKIIWNIETQKYDSMRESLEAYLETWHKTNDEFIESMHLVESSLVETSETRRLDALEKSLTVMLEETYEKMLHYAHNLKSPLTTLHMLGIILPILGLVILPLLVSFMPAVRWYHLFLLYNVTLPLIVYFIGKDILSKRPTGYGGSDADARIENQDGSFLGFRFTPFLAAIFVLVVFLLIGFLPLIMHTANPDFDFVHYKDSDRNREPQCMLTFCSIDVTIPEQTEGVLYHTIEYREIIVDEETKETGSFGPFGLVATLLSLCIPLALGVSLGIYYRMRSRGILKRREEAKKLELEFASALFQLGNRLADGLPLEIAFSKVAVTMPDTVSGRFFQQVSINITKLGLSVEDALFHEKYGAVHQYPSNIIESSMKVLVESSKKGPIIASQAIINVANYIKEMHRVDERLKDLMSDVISSMRSQITFLTPTIAGVVMGITSMITAILGKLGARVAALGAETSVPGGAGMGTSLLSTFSGGAVGTYFFQIIVGLYVVQIVFILTILVNGIENGSDKIAERAMLGENMVKSTMTYVLLSFVVILLFNMVAANIVPG